VYYLGALPGVPDVPAGGDTYHSPDEIGAYAAWLDTRIDEYLAALSAAKSTQNGNAIFIDFLPWVVTWKAELTRLRVDLGNWGGVGSVLSNPLAWLPGGQLGNPLLGAWDRLRTRHAALLEFARRMENAGLGHPELPGLPSAGPLFGGGGPSATTIGVFAVAVGAISAYLLWELAPLPSKPTAALAGAAIGAGGTFLALR
jgi:hypothetical protein